jgi:hypothetical protein
MPTTFTAIVTQPVNINDKRRRRVGADEDAQFLSGANAGVRNVSLNPRTAVLGRRVHAGVFQQPGSGARFFVFVANEIALLLGETDLPTEKSGHTHRRLLQHLPPRRLPRLGHLLPSLSRV